jgi:beta-lactamase regulating signal transducer with metallopeptidase domain/multidrug efflux pump subunit AcrA (membrane-fusion protein)
MSLFPHASLQHLVLETALIVVVADSLVAVAALAVAACLKRKPAAAHCVLAVALAWIFVVPLGAVARAVSGVSIISLPGPAEAFVSALESSAPPDAVGIEAALKVTPALESAKAPFRDTSSPNRPRLAADSAAPMRVSATREIPRTSDPTLSEAAVAASGSRPSRLGTSIWTAIGAAWLLGVLVLLTRTLRSYARMRTIRRTLTVLPAESFGPVLDDVRRRLNLVRLPQITSSDRVWTPCVLGLLRPAIVLPADALRNVSRRQLGDVLVHEGAHVVRHDCVMALIQKIAGSLFWPHPLIHWLNRRLTSVREEVCDNYVLAGTDAVSYGETLLQFAQVVGHERNVPAAVAMLHGGGSLEKRIARLIDERRNRHTRAGNFSRVLALVAFGSLFLLACGGRGRSEGPVAVKSEVGKSEIGSSETVRKAGTTNWIAETPPPKTSRSAPAAAAPPGKSDKGNNRIVIVRADGLPELLSQAALNSVQLVPGKPHTLRVPEEVRIKWGMRRDNVDRLAIAKRTSAIPPLVLSGSMALNPNTMYRLRPFPLSPSGVTVVEIGKVADSSGAGKGKGVDREREFRAGDRVRKGQLLAALYNVEVANTENDLIDAFSQLKIDEEILKRQQSEAKDTVGTSISLLTTKRNVQADRNSANRAMRTLRGWGIPEKEVQAIVAQAEKPRSNGAPRVGTPGVEWGRIEIHSPIDGVVLERNVTLHEVVVDRDTTFFSVANVDRLLVYAQLPEYKRFVVEALGPHPAWTIAFDRVRSTGGFLDEIGTQIDQAVVEGRNQGTVSLKGDVDNKQGLLRSGQFVTIHLPLPIEGDCVEVPGTCITSSDDATVVFVQTDPAKPEFTAQRVIDVARFNKSRHFLWSKPIANGEGAPAAEAVQERLPLEPVTEGTRLVQNGVDELWRILKEREKQESEK